MDDSRSANAIATFSSS